MNKKGNFADIVWYLEFAMGFLIVASIVLMFVFQFNQNVQLINDSTIPAQVKTTSNNYANFLPRGVDYLFIFLLPIFVGFSIYAARLIPSSPYFIYVGIFAMLLLPFGAMMIENFYANWISQTIISQSQAGMKFMPFVLNNLRYVALFYAASVAIALYSKERE